MSAPLCSLLTATLMSISVTACYSGNSGSSTITGKVALAGQQVPSGTVVILAGPASAQAVADTSGAYTAAKLPKGTYAVLAQLPSTVEGEQVVEVTVEDGKTATAPTLNFTPLGQITGIATLGQATGNAGIVITVANSSLVTVTDDSGHFTLSNVPSGTHDITASLNGYTAASKTGLAVPYKTAVDAGTLTLVKGNGSGAGSISGKVTVPSSVSVAQIVLTLTGPVTQSSHPQADGSFTFSNLPDGAYLVTAAGPGLSPPSAVLSATLTNGSAATGIDFVFVPANASNTGSIAGTVTLTGLTDASGVVITLTGPQSAGTVTAQSGTYSFSNLPDGDYLVTATANSVVPPTAVRSVTLSGGNASTGQDFTLQVVGSVSGTVTANGSPAGGANVAVSGTTLLTVALSDGTYQIAGVPVGTATLVAVANGTNPSTQTVTVTRGQNSTLDFALTVAQGVTTQLASQALVVGNGGQANIRVTALSGGADAGSTVSGTDGGYAIGGLPEGTFALTFSNPDGGYHETIPLVLTLPNSDGFVLDNGALTGLAPLELQAGNRVVSQHSVDRMAGPQNGEVVVRTGDLCLNGGGSSTATDVSRHPKITGAIEEGGLPSGCTGQLTVIDASGSVTPIGHGQSPNQGAQIAPNSGAVVYFDDFGGNPGNGQGDLYLHPGVGADVLLSNAAYTNTVQFSNDGTKTIFEGNDPTAGEALYCSDLVTGATTEVTNNIPYGLVQMQTTSTNGVVFAQYQYTGLPPYYYIYNVYAGSCAGGPVAQLTTGGSDSLIPGYFTVSADGTYVLVGTLDVSPNGSPYLTAISMDGTVKTPITPESQYLQVQPQTYLVGTNSQPLSLYQVTLGVVDGGPGFVVNSGAVGVGATPNNAVNYDTFMLNQTKVVFAGFDGDGGSGLYVADIAMNSPATYLTGPAGYNIYKMSETTMVVADYDPNTGQADNLRSIVFPAGGGQPSVNTLENSGDFQIYSTTTGAFAYQLVTGPNAGDFVVVTLDGTGRTDLGPIVLDTSINGSAVALSGDGQHLALEVLGTDGGNSTLEVVSAPYTATSTPTAVTLGAQEFQFSSDNQVLEIWDQVNSNYGPTLGRFQLANADGSGLHALVNNSLVQPAQENGSGALIFPGDLDPVTGVATLYASRYTGPAIPLLGLADDGVWFGPNLIYGARIDSPEPYGFQDGIYLIPSP
jgi:hypothetical protein